MQFALTARNSLWILFFLAAATRLLWLGYPDQVVFDEVHFGKFITAYCCSGERIFDIHPPHAKLLIAGAGRLAGYAGGFDFKNIGESYGTVPVWGLRLVPALTGVALPLILFVLMRQLGASLSAALLVGLATVFDNALVVQSRVISLDGVLLLATFGSISTFLAGINSRARAGIGWYVASGALVGLAVGAKFTGLSAVGMVILLMLWQAAKDRDPRQAPVWLGRVVVIILSAVAVYAAGWVGHYALLTAPGPGDAWQQVSGHVAADTLAMHKIMLNANYNLTATHPYSSQWWTWPIMQRPVFYWQGTGRAAIYFLGNPVVWWGALIVFLAACLAAFQSFAVHRQGLRSLSPAAWLLLAGFVISLGPLTRVPRALFLYHYLTPLLFAWLFGALWLDQLWKPKWLGPVALLIIIIFIFFSPLTYGWPAPQWWWDHLFWLPTWR